MQRAAIILMVITVASKGLGFLREVLLSYYYGASSTSDAYLIALTIPGVIFALVSSSIAVGYVPIYSRVVAAQGVGAGDHFTNNLINAMLIVSTFLIAITVVLAPQIVFAFAPGFSSDAAAMAVDFTRIFVFGIYISGLLAIYTAYLQARRSFISAAAVGIVFNLVVLLSICVSAQAGAVVLIVGTLLAKALEVVFLVPSLKTTGYRYAFALDLKDADLKSLAIMSVPLVLGVSVNQLNVLVDRSLASLISVGGVSALNYANHLNQLLLGVFVVTIATVVFPSFANMFVNGSTDRLTLAVTKAVNVVSLLIIPSSVFFVFFSEQIVKVVYGRGHFDSSAVTMTGDALLYFSIGMIGYAQREILSRVYYAMHDSRTPVNNAVIGVLLNIALSVLLSRYMGISGLALGTSLSGVVTSSLLFWKLKRALPQLDLGAMLRVVVLSGLVSLLAVGFSRGIFDYAQATGGMLIGLVFCASVTFLLCGVGAHVLRIEGAGLLFDRFRMIRRRY